MLRGEIDAGDAATAEELRRAYEAALAETIERVGVGPAAEQSGVSTERLRTLVDGGSADLAVAEVAAVLATDEDRPDAETIAAEARDLLLMGMTTAVLDVESLASELGGPLDPKELQQKIEGRHPMTLAEFAAVHHHLATATE